MIRWIAPISLLALASVAVPAHPAPPKPKPIKGAYQAVVPVTAACRPGVPASEDLHPITLPARGRIVIDLAGKGFDMDLELMSTTGGTIAKSHRTGVTEQINYRIKRPGKYTIRVCNYIAGPIGDVTFEFIY